MIRLTFCLRHEPHEISSRQPKSHNKLLVYKYYRDFVGSERMQKKKKSTSTPSPCSRTAADCFIIYCCLFLSLRREGKLVQWIKSTLFKKKNTEKKMCTNKQRSDVPFPLPFLPVSAACRVGVENEWKWRSGVDKIRGERQEGCGHGRRGREHAEVPLRRVFRTPAEDRNWQTECATSWWQPSFQPYFTQVYMKSCQICFYNRQLSDTEKVAFHKIFI